MQASDLARKAAIAYVHARDVRKAVMTIEHRQALWLADALDRNGLAQSRLDEDERLRQARSGATEAVRRSPGHRDVFAGASWEAVLAAANRNPLVYLVPGDISSTALIVDPASEDEVSAVPLPGLSLSTLFSELETYFRFFEDPASQDPGSVPGDAWPDVLDDACAWAWDHVMEPVLSAIGRVPQLTLVPVGALQSSAAPRFLDSRHYAPVRSPLGVRRNDFWLYPERSRTTPRAGWCPRHRHPRDNRCDRSWWGGVRTTGVCRCGGWGSRSTDCAAATGESSRDNRTRPVGDRGLRCHPLRLSRDRTDWRSPLQLSSGGRWRIAPRADSRIG